MALSAFVECKHLLKVIKSLTVFQSTSQPVQYVQILPVRECEILALRNTRESFPIDFSGAGFQADSLNLPIYETVRQW